jgi:hypothetical protein
MRFRFPLGRRRPLLILSVALLGTGLLAWMLPQDAPRGRSGIVKQAEDQPNSLDDQMLAMKKQLKALSAGLAESSPTAELLGYVTAMQELVLQAKLHDPSNLEDQPVARRSAHKNAFRSDMLRLLIELASLELDLIEERNEDASARITGALFKLRNASHERYQKT